MNFVFLLLTSILISALPLLGLAFLSLNPSRLKNLINQFVALSAGSLMGGAFIHLLPESFELLSAELSLGLTLISFLGFLIIEKVLHWQHCHHQDCEIHSFGYMNLIGDGLHNFLDGLVLASAFGADLSLGLAAAVAIALHEIPQEVGDFAVLLKAGFSRSQALKLNLLIAATAIFGAVSGFALQQQIESFSTYLLPIAAGGFIYIAASDLLPKLREETNQKQFWSSFSWIIGGILVMLLLKLRS
ncbi:MAG: ZIP family metal transporter [Candidatus Pacebacteria bacterium]|nr:ZIP family metal transporter [Candidatus Paceibacterota bacterium]